MKYQSIVGVCLSIGLIFGMVVVPGVWHAVANSCTLKMTLTVKDTQDGFVGPTGTVWTIEPDCTFRVSRIFNQNVAEPHLKGRLTPEQQARLSEVLAKDAPAELPAQIGEASSVNARRITLEYGGKVSILTMAAGDRDMGAIRTGDPLHPARRLLEVAEAVKDMLGS
jgi:hypothetical protein